MHNVEKVAAVFDVFERFIRVHDFRQLKQNEHENRIELRSKQNTQ